ncbi:MAG: hypothetical protein APF78_05265 [Sphingomonadales bacterium BRH_c3]|nr:MAG: hypothetical protein APF78_05265 [Sphingomonadales bacterium BRH_c3]
MQLNPADFGLIDDGSTIEVNVMEVQKGRIEDAVAAFQQAFAEYKPEGFKVIFACADIANERITWVHRYDKGFDLKNRFYLGKFGDFAHTLWAGTRYDALAASPEDLQS